MSRRGARSAFTLVEVVLAIGIAIGLLTVVLYFYQQAAALRTQLLVEAERVSAVRLIMDRITQDLRCASVAPALGRRLNGGASSLRFVKLDLPQPNVRSGEAGRGRTPPETGLKWVTYELGTAMEGTNATVTGLVRTEEPCLELRRRTAVQPQKSARVEEDEKVVEAPEPVSEAIGYLRFRYFGGAGWVESWTEGSLPVAVEVTLASEAPAEEERPAERTGGQPSAPQQEVFRRVICLPVSGLAGTAGQADESSESGTAETGGRP